MTHSELAEVAIRMKDIAKAKEVVDGRGESTPLIPVSDPRPLAPHSSELRGYLLMLASSLSFSGMTILIRIMEDLYDFPVMSAVLLRGTTITMLALVHIVTSVPILQTFKELTPKQRALLGFRGLSGGLGLATLYLALNKLPAGEAITIFFSTPVLTMLFSYLALGEAVTLLDLVSAATSFIGVFLVAHPQLRHSEDLVSFNDRLVGTVYALLAAFFSSAAYVMVRALGTKIHFMLSVVSNSLMSIVVAVALGGVLIPENLLQGREVLFIAVLSSLFAFAAQAFLNEGLQHCRAGPGVLIRNLDVPIVSFLGVAFLGEAPSMFSIVGSCLVLASGMMIGFGKIVRR